ERDRSARPRWPSPGDPPGPRVLECEAHLLPVPRPADRDRSGKEVVGAVTLVELEQPPAATRARVAPRPPLQLVTARHTGFGLNPHNGLRLAVTHVDQSAIIERKQRQTRRPADRRKRTPERRRPFAPGRDSIARAACRRLSSLRVASAVSASSSATSGQPVSRTTPASSRTPSRAAFSSHAR